MQGSEWEGWYAAPAPFGQTTFKIKILEVDLQGEFKGEGEDKQGQFEVRGTIQGSEIEFVKDYKENGNHKGIIYKGRIEENKISGKYEFLYKALFIRLNVCEDFEMKLIT
ncbi:uncharacterized protein LOC111697562 isoform X2 [Eurytemora carolleeae]|uniref:uncharacterized protein LOC111697562 isoform X2 n=1 Tax=Eurytemora carolleeae TaxID=1294199 RepID=UPI000C75870B|nr:uncharacterized protein LOC111697562 isoform X2 [Eurytemora carolleeae]|eukprot:XP_023323371.1 uncharacterized protein LOC111697562 isoform X2 [Eurytemora affinis]